MTSDTTRLAALLDARHTCLCNMRELGLRQLETIRAHDLSLLMKILAGKQRLLTQLQEIARQLEPFRAQAPDSRRWSSPGERDRCAQVVRQCDALLAEIVTQEKQSESLLAADRDEAATRLRGANVATRARGAYATHGEPVYRQLDLSSDS